MLRRLLALLSAKPSPRVETPPYRHELIEAGYRDPVVYLDPYSGWEVLEREHAISGDYDFKDPPVYGW